VTDSLDKYFPDYPGGEKITLHHLLTHSSGIPEFDFSLVFKSLDEIIANFKNRPLNFEPGSKAEYSTSGFILLRKIVEKLTGMNHQQYVIENIMKPLGLKNSGYNNGRDVVQYLGRGYWNGDDGLEEAELYDKSKQGSIYSNTTDLFIYSRALIQGDFLSPESKKQMFSAHIKDGGITNMGHSWGYGWALDSSHGEQRIWHNGHIFGFCAMLAVYPEQELTIVVMSNVQNNSPVEKINEALAAIALGKKYELPKVRREITLEKEKLGRLAGTYQYSPDFLIEVTLDGGRLYLQGTGQPRLRLRAMTPLTFFLKEADLEIHFKEKEGGINELIIHQYENEMSAKKIN
jgi:CubicO group peptidase (beta-lactamase class C family)